MEPSWFEVSVAFCAAHLIAGFPHLVINFFSLLEPFLSLKSYLCTWKTVPRFKAGKQYFYMASLNLKEDGLQYRLAVCEAGEVSPMTTCQYRSISPTILSQQYWHILHIYIFAEKVRKAPQWCLLHYVDIYSQDSCSCFSKQGHANAAIAAIKHLLFMSIFPKYSMNNFLSTSHTVWLFRHKL